MISSISTTSGLRTAGRRLGLLSTIAAVALLAAACGGFDRERAIGEFEDELGLTETTATCVVDTLIDEYGEDGLGGQLTEEQAMSAVFAIDGCQRGEATAVTGGPDGSPEGGTATIGSTAVATGLGTPDEALTDDTVWSASPERLAELSTRCVAGDYDACDDLFWESAPGSPEEDLGWTCGGTDTRTFPCS